jgi:hypothetical protein
MDCSEKHHHLRSSPLFGIDRTAWDKVPVGAKGQTFNNQCQSLCVAIILLLWPAFITSNAFGTNTDIPAVVFDAGQEG